MSQNEKWLFTLRPTVLLYKAIHLTETGKATQTPTVRKIEYENILTDLAGCGIS